MCVANSVFISGGCLIASFQVHFKVKILSSFTVTNLYESLLLNTKEGILKNVGNQTVDGPH